MAWPNLQPQAPSPRQRTSARPPSISPPIASQRALCRIGRTARRHNEAASSHPTRRFPASVAPSPTSAADPNPHSRRLCPAGSFLGDFRTPAGARNSSRIQTVRFSACSADNCRSASDPNCAPRILIYRSRGGFVAAGVGPFQTGRFHETTVHNCCAAFRTTDLGETAMSVISELTTRHPA